MSECHPERCLANCARVEELTGHIDRHNAQLDALITMSTDDTPERAAESVREFMQQLRPGDAIPSSEELAREFREYNGEDYTSLTEHVQRLEQKRHDMTAHCSGPLGMRAVSEGIEYTARVCRSPIEPLGVRSEPTVIVRKIAGA